MPASGPVTNPGLTDPFRCLGSENEVSAIGIGAYFCLHRFFNEVSNAVLGPLLHISTAEVETIHPLVVAMPVVTLTYPSCHGHPTRAAELLRLFAGFHEGPGSEQSGKSRPGAG